MHLSSVQLIWIGLILSLLGVFLPLLMVVHAVESTFFLNFFSFIASILGLFLGLIGAATYIREHRK